ncbi:MAG: hypothetical protein ABSE05_01230 [Syntrophales bacterium]
MEETKTFRITSDKAYGSHLIEMPVVFKRDRLLKTFSRASVNCCNYAGMKDKLLK